MIWLDLKAKRYFVWICQDYLANLVKLKDFLLTVLTSMDFKFINADFMELKIQTSMALEIEQIEEVIINQVIQMRKRLNPLQV